MKKNCYIITALLTVVIVSFLVLDSIDTINREDSFFLPSAESFFWYMVSSEIISIMIIFAYGVLSLIQLKKSTPRIILIFSGFVFYKSFGFFISSNWWLGLLILVVGLLPALYELIKYGRLVKNAPCLVQPYGRLLIVAGVVSCLDFANRIYSLNTLFYSGRIFDMPENFYYTYTVILVNVICMTIFCFIRNRRTSVLYRMFFMSSVTFGIISTVSQVISAAISGCLAIWTPLSNLLSLVLVLLILIHAFKTRHESIITQEHIGVAPQTEIPVS